MSQTMNSHLAQPTTGATRRGPRTEVVVNLRLAAHAQQSRKRQANRVNRQPPHCDCPDAAITAKGMCVQGGRQTTTGGGVLPWDR